MEIMRLSQQYAPTLKEDPADAEIASHRLLVRAGMIRKVAGGVYTFLPLGMRVLTKIENIVREEMNAIGAHEILMPALRLVSCGTNRAVGTITALSLCDWKIAMVVASASDQPTKNW